MSEINTDSSENTELPAYVVDAGPIENSGVTAEIDYEKSMQMRLDLAMSSIQKYSALAAFDDDASSWLAKWGAYYSAIKPVIAKNDFSKAYEIEVPVTE